MKEERTYLFAPIHTFYLVHYVKIDYKAIANTLFLNVPAINNYVSCVVVRDVALKIYQRLELYSSYKVCVLSRTSVLFLIFGLNIDFS